jgi:hypothetical protein
MRAGGRVEFDFEEIAGAQQDPSVKNHAAFAELGSAAWNYSGRETFGGHYSNGQVNGKSRPPARLVGDKHAPDLPLTGSRLQITEVQREAVQQYNAGRCDLANDISYEEMANRNRGALSRVV